MSASASPPPDRQPDRLHADLTAELPLGLLVYRLEEPGDPGSFRIVHANAAAGRLLGMEDLSPFIGRLVREVVPEDERSGDYELLLRVAETGVPASMGRIHVDNPRLGAHGIFQGQAFPLPDRSVGVVFEDIEEQVRLEERLAGNEREYRALTEATLEGVAIVREGRIVLANSALATTLGRSAEELLGHPPGEAVGFEWTASQAEPDGVAPHVIEGEVRRPDGTALPVEVRSRPIEYEGAPAQALIVRDISERRASIRALERQAIRFRAIFDSAFQLIGLLSPDGTLLEANRTALEFGGLTAEDVIGKPFWECHWWSHSERAQHELKEAIRQAATGEFVRYNAKVRGVGDERAVIDFSLKPVLDQGRVILLIPEGRDITEAIRTQRALRRLQRRTARILNAAGEGIVGVGPDGRVTFANEAAASLLGPPARELVGRPHSEVLRHTEPDGTVPEALPVDRVLRRERTRRVWNVLFERADAEPFPVEYIVSPLREEGETGAVVVFRDVSEREAADAALRESEERYRALFGALHEGVVLQGADGAILAVNPAAEQILGLSADQLAGRTSLDPRWEVITPDGEPLPGDRHPAMVALRTGEPVQGFVQGVRQPSGALRWILVNASLIWGEDRSAPEAVVATFYDITEQQEAEEALRQSELRNRTTLGTLSEGVLLVNPDGTLITANPAARALLGLQDDAFPNLLTQGVWEVIQEDGSPFPSEEMPIQQVARTGEEVRGVIQGFCQPNGACVWVSVNAQPVLDRPGARPDAVVVSIVDVTERREAEVALREREAQLRTAQKIAHIGSWRWEPDSDTITWSDELYRIYGLEPGSVDSDFQAYLQMVHPEDREEVEREIREGMERRRPYEVLHRVVRPDGTVRQVHGLGEPVLDEQGGLLALQGTAQDVTEQVQAREALQRYARELEERNAELEQFAYVASHDLQEPLRMVTSFLQLLQRRYSGKLDDTADEYIAYAVDGAKRMQRLIQDLLAFSRVGTRGKAFQRVDTAQIAEEVVTDLGPAIAEQGGRVDLGALPIVEADPTQVRQLLQNLLGNALKFRGAAAPQVSLSAERARRGGRAVWLFTVSDNGIGIAEEHRERIFQIFQRLHTRDEYEGTGIGLAICRKIVERHGGEIWLDSEVGRGSTFHFTLPVQPHRPDASSNHE